jgi:uncharacterized protein
MTDIIVMKTTGRNAPKVELGLPNPKNLIKGAYKTKTWNHDVSEDERLFTGIWECTPGKVSCTYEEWEFCHFIEGKAILTNENGKKWTVKKGDGFIIPAGFKGTWETVEKVRKHYVILMPKTKKK